LIVTYMYKNQKLSVVSSHVPRIGDKVDFKTNRMKTTKFLKVTHVDHSIVEEKMVFGTEERARVILE